MIIYLSLLVCIIGLIVYILNSPSKTPSPRSATWAEIGRIMFGVGLFVFLLLYKASSTFSFLR